MKTDFILYKEDSKDPIIVNENSNSELLKRCQDNWYHTKDIKYFDSKNWKDKLGLGKLIKRNKQPEYLFIHIPKTGGISFKFNVIYNDYMDKKIVIYHKIRYPALEVSDLDIYNESRKMFTLLRDPVKTIISSYFYFNNMTKMGLTEFTNQFQNIQIKFLLGYDTFSKYEVTEEDVKKIIQLIEDKKLVVGIHKTEKMNEIYNLLELPLEKVDNYILNKKVDVNYKSRDVSHSQKQHIKKMNVYDEMLYEYVLNS